MANPSLQTLLAQLQQWGSQGGASAPDWQSFMPKSGSMPTGEEAPGDKSGAQPQGAWAKLGQLLAPQTTAQAGSGKGIFGMLGGGSGGSSKGGGTSVG